MSTDDKSIDRREAVRRVSILLGGMAFVGTRPLAFLEEHDVHARVAALAESGQAVGPFTAADVAFLNEVAETMLPATTTPGAKAARVGPFMALMVNDSYEPADQKIFRDGMRKLDDESRKANGVAFMKATPRQRLALLTRLDREQKTYMEAVEAAQRRAAGQKANAYVPDQRKEMAPAPDANAAPAITADSPAHYFRMMKELALLGYFTSEIGYTQAQRYAESPGRFDPCVPYKKGERAWAGHA